MKQTLSALLCILLVAAVLSGCSSSPSSNGASSATPASVATPSPAAAEESPAAEATPEPTAEPTPVPAKTDVVIGEVAELNGMALQVAKVEKSQGTDFDKPKAGQEYVVVTVLIKNAGDATLSYNPFYFKMKNSQGVITDAAISLMAPDTALSSGELLPGGLVSGTVVFEQPKDDPALTFLYEDTGLFSDKSITVDLSKTADGVALLQQGEIKVGEEQIVGIGQENTLDSVSVTLNKVTRSMGDDFMKPKAGKEYVIVEVTIKNAGTDTISFNSLYFKMRNSLGQVEMMTLLSFASDDALQSGELAAGGTVTGTVAFEQPKDDAALALIYQPDLFSTKYLAFRLQ